MPSDGLTLALVHVTTGFAFAALAALTCNLLVISALHLRIRRRGPRILPGPLPERELPTVLIQLPVYNEPNVVGRVIAAVAALDWPRDRLRVQVLDDSTDASAQVTAELVDGLRAAGLDIHQIRRSNRIGYKAGALANGLAYDDSPFVAIFDADFIPPPSFLRRAMPTIVGDPRLAFVQARWEHLNAAENALTTAQAMMIDAHFAVEQRVRCRTGLMLPFNGTCGIWRRAAIDDAGGWAADTLCEDLDLSIRARLAGWGAVFRDDISVPGELPTTLAGWRAQQFRWTKGFAQAARKLLWPVWRSRLPLRIKLALTLQTCQPLCYPLTGLSLLGTLPLLVEPGGTNTILPMFGAVVAVLGVSASAGFLALSRVALGRTGWARFPWNFVVILLLNAGLMVSNSRAVFEAAIGRPSAFTRTPKRGGAAMVVARDAAGPNGAVELGTGCVLGVALAHAAGWLSPLFSLSIGGLLVVGAGLARERWISAPRSAAAWPQPSRERQPAE